MPNTSDYQHLQAQLYPPGPAFDSDQDDTLPNVRLAFADELNRFDGLAASLLSSEGFPEGAAYLLPEWERMAGLPDPCTGTIVSTAGRQAALAQKLGSLGGQSRAYFIALAAQLGFTATIGETPATFEWVMNVSAETGLAPRAALECIVNRYKPAQTTVTFTYPP